MERDTEAVIAPHLGAQDVEVRLGRLDGGRLLAVEEAHLDHGQVGGDGKAADTILTLVPYYAWNNRGEKSMIVWPPRAAGK